MALLSSQTPYQGVASDEMWLWEYAQQFTLAAAADADQLVAWVHSDPDPTFPTVHWSFYADNAGAPDLNNVVASGSIAAANYTADVFETIAGKIRYKLTLPLNPAVSLLAATPYWFSLYSDDPGTPVFQLCFYTDTVDGTGADRWIGPPSPDPSFNTSWFPMAYQLYGVEGQAAQEIVVGDEPLGVRYRAYITGAADSLPDYELPLQALSIRKKSGTPSTVNLTLAWDDNAIAAVYARPNGDIKVDRSVLYSDGTEPAVELINTAVDDVREDKGGTSRSWSMSGSRQSTNQTPVTVALTGVSYRMTRTDSLQLRAAVDPAARAADTFTYGADAVVADSVIITVANGIENMEIVG